MYGYVYKTTDLLKNKIYIGQHKGHIFDNTYYGSGSWFRAVLQKYGKDNFNSEICEKLETAIYKLVRFGIISGVIEARQNAFKELCDMMVSSDCDDAADKVIKELSVEHKENFLDYYK